MQGEEQEKPKKSGWKNRAWAIVALLILVGGIGGFRATVAKLPHAEWRNEYKPLSWKTSGVCIDDAEAFWKASAGDARMELRAYSYPVCRLELDEAEGAGHVTIRFFNGEGVQMGDRVYIQYKDGKFIPRENNSMQVTEKEATVRLEDGFLTRDEYILHQFNQDARLWRVEVDCRPEGGDASPLGHLSVIPHDL